MNAHFLRTLLTSALLLIGLMSDLQAQLQPILIQNETVRVYYAPATGQFTLTAIQSGRTFALQGSLAGVSGEAKTVTVTDRTFGAGQAIKWRDADGAGGKIMVFPKLPFALLRARLKNGGTAATVLNRVPVASWLVDWGKPATALITLGTGGLLPPGQNPGSYAWLTVVEPQSRNGLVAGWLTHERASGVLFSRVEGDRVHIEARCDYGKLRLAPGTSAETETLAIGYFDDARLGLEAWADAVTKVYSIKLPPLPTGFCTWYTEKHGGSSDEKHLAELTELAARNLKPFGFDFVQIDDHWQQGDSKGNGPKKNFTSFAPDGPYPAGMKATADNIKAHGLVPGIWFMPFAGTHNDPWFADKQHLFVKREDGTPYDTSWGGTSLDMTHPVAREYLRSIVERIAHEWGYAYFKLDGLYTGTATKQVYVNSGYKEDGMGDAVFADPDKTNTEAFRDGLKLVRDAAGSRVFFLGCTATQNMRSYAGSFGLVDAMRIGPDNSGNWKKWAQTSPVFGSRHYFLHGRIWYNDPDPFYVRASIPLAEARTIASWPAIAGQLNSNSDWIPDLPAERLDILKRTMPSHGCMARPLDLFEHDPPRLWLVSDTTGQTRRDIVALFNWADTETQFDTPLARFGLAENTEYVAFDYWANTFLPPFKGSLQTTLAAHHCRILAVRELLDRPFLLSTNRHVTQGMVDVFEETWNGATKTLSGRSRIVAGDAYELRIVASGKGTDWHAAGAQVAPADTASGVQVAGMKQTDNLVRVTLHSPVSREVAWSIPFRQGPVPSV